VQSQFGFEIAFARTEIGGYCSHCQALRAKDDLRAKEDQGEKQAV
jgi:hypothetical protein